MTQRQSRAIRLGPLAIGGGAPVMVRFIRAKDGRREYKGTLEAYDNGLVTVSCPDGTTLSFDKKETSWVKLDDFGGF